VRTPRAGGPARSHTLRLSIAAKDLHHELTRKKDSAAVPAPGKLAPLDALGLAMLAHGDEFGPDSAFGASLVALGRAQCKVVALQDARAGTLREAFIRALGRYEDEIVEYQAARKKLESRRCAARL
jgi:hypothetical protein